MSSTQIRISTLLLTGTSLGAIASAQTSRAYVGIGSETYGRSHSFTISADGSAIAYYSAAPNLVLGDNLDYSDCFVTTYPGFVTERVSVSWFEVPGIGHTPDVLTPDRPAISSTGRYVAFSTAATNLDNPESDTTGLSDVYLRDRELDTTKHISRGLGSFPNGASWVSPGAISANGRFVAFEGTSSNLIAGDTNVARDVFVRDTGSNVTERVSVTSAGVEGDAASRFASISEDGRFVLFQSLSSNLGPDANAGFDVFLRDRTLGTTTIVSAGIAPDQEFGGESPAMSPDARFVVFVTFANIAPGDTASDSDVYLKDLQTGTFEQISVSSAGLPGTGGTPYAPSVSGDGRLVTFHSDRPGLVPGDTNDVDTFVRDRVLGTTELLSVSTSGTPGNGTSQFACVASNGSAAVFSSVATNLVSGDMNGLEDGFVRGLLPPNDACANALFIAGTGEFPVSGAAATTGLDGQDCGPGMPRDLWFAWTSTFTGVADIDTCQTSGDTRLAARNQGCLAGAPIACDDDGCGTLGGGARLQIPVAQGSFYLIQVATVSGTGAGVMRIANAPSYDDCASALAISGYGTFPFDTTHASTGSQGQSGCGSGIGSDAWFQWTSPATGDVALSTCQGNSFPTKVAVHTGSGCPIGAPIACNDDACGSNARLCFPAVAGATYMFHIGSETAEGGPGLFDLVPSPTLSGCAPLDDGWSDLAYGVQGGGSAAWLHRFGEVGTTTTVGTVSTAWGDLTGPPPSGTGRVAIWEDPDDDGVPDDAVLLQFVDVSIIGGSTDALQSVSLSPPVVVSGYFFVGAGMQHADGFRPAPIDQGGTCGGWERAWLVSSNGLTPLDYANLPANAMSPTRLEDLGIYGQFLLRVSCLASDPFVLFCPGDGTGTPCPCANHSVAGANEGCVSSLAIAGRVRATGAPSMSADTMTLFGTQMPSSSALYFQGTSQQNGGAGVVFGDGLRCAAGSVTRLATKTNAAGASQYPGPGDVPISIRGGNSPGALRTYQVWYRNAAGFCTSATFNLTNGLQTTWLP